MPYLSKRISTFIQPTVEQLHDQLARLWRSCGPALAVTGALLSARLDRRRQHAEDVRSACLTAMDSGKEGFLMMRPMHEQAGRRMDFLIQDCNTHGARHTGLPAKDLLGRRLSELHDNAGIADLAQACRHAMAAGVHDQELEANCDGERVWLQRRIVRTDAGLAITVRDISETRANHDILTKMAHVDALTGLPNRLWLMHFLPCAIERAAAGASVLAVLFIDLDDFKSVNDTFGHDAGDALLVAAAGRLAATIRMEDKLARLGGDEFVIVLERADQADIVQVAGRIIAAMAEDFMLDDCGYRQTHASIGISLYPQDGGCAASLLRHADQAMYVAKSSGKGRYVFHAASPARHACPDQPAEALSSLRA